jgi:CHAT domain-containing protein/tetratricopeptide (TPR) repeat protein
MILGEMWAGWLTMWVVLAPSLFGLSWLVAKLLGNSVQERLLRFLTGGVLLATACIGLWYAILEIGFGFGVDIGTAAVFSVLVTVPVFAAAIALVVLKRLPDFIPDFNSLALLVISFALMTASLIGIGHQSLPWMPGITQREIRLSGVALAAGLTWFLVSRGFFASSSRPIVPFVSRLLATALGSFFLAVIGLCLVYAVDLRLLPPEDLAGLTVSKGLSFFCLALLLWRLTIWRLHTAFAWVCVAVAAAASIYLGSTAGSDRERLANLDEPVRRAQSALHTGDFDDALKRWEEIVKVRADALPESHGLVGEALVGVGEALHRLGRSNEAIDRLRTALEIADAQPRGATLDPSLVRARLVMVCLQAGRGSEAESYLDQIDVEEVVRLLGRSEENVALMVEVAESFRRSGRLGNAEFLFQKTLETIELGFQRRPGVTTTALQGLARILIETDRHDEAAEIVGPLQHSFGGSGLPLQVAETLRLEAEIESALGKSAAAVGLQRKALRFYTDSFGLDHAETAVVLGELGRYLLDAGNPPGAQIACENARSILLRQFPPESPQVVHAEFELARAYAAVGRLEEAGTLFESCADRWQALFGGGYHGIADALFERAAVAAESGDHSKASGLYSGAIDAYISGLETVFPVLSGPQQAAALGRVQSKVSEYLLHTARERQGDSNAVSECFRRWLRIKGLMLDVQRARGEMLARSSSPKARKILTELRTVEGRLAQLWFRGRVDRIGREEGASLRAKKSELEQRLHGLLAASGFWGQSPEASLQRLQEAMPVDATYIDYCRVRGSDRTERYLAFVLSKNGDPDLIDVGPAPTIDGRVVDYLLMVGQGMDRTRDAGQIHQAVYDAVFLPLDRHLTGTRTLLISPDGFLARLPFSAVKDRSSTYLEDRFQISYLSSGRDAALWGMPSTRKHSAIIFADPDFDAPPPADHDASESTERTPSGFTWGRPPFHDVRLERLPGTLREAEVVADLLESKTSLDVLVFTGINASEDATAFVESPWLLHFATHGYSIPKLRPTAPLAYEGAWDDPPSRLRKAAPDDNPMVRAGLALAGANEAFRRMSPRGVLTLDEIMLMTLVDTEIVVISACDSGIGAAREGEGVFGVGGAFLAAGSKSVVVTLWSVADEPTAQLMESFYARWLSGEPKAEALRNARAWLRRLYPSPAIWAPFILVGDPS